jgi:hypothetical protein
MAECQNNSFKSKSPKEDDDMSEAHTSLDDARAPESNDPNMAKQRENGDQQKKDRHVANSNRTESHSEKRAESEKSNNDENSKVESSREPQGKNNQWDRSRAESNFESGYDSQSISGRDHSAAEIGKDPRTVTDPGKSYSQAVKTNITQESYNNGSTKVRK